jgi:glycosyltransferase involved in cell wall biosynthesis
MSKSGTSHPPIRVANVIEEGRVGGPQIRMVRVAEALGAEFETVIVMPLRESEAFRELCDAHKVQYLAVPLTRLTRQWQLALAYALFSPIETIRLARLFRREGIVLVHASGGSWQYKAVLAARFARLPVIWHLNDTMMPRWVHAIFSIVQRFSSGFIFASYRSRQYYGRVLGNRPDAVVPATVSPEYFDPEIDLHEESDIPAVFEGMFVVGTVANINPVKGLETFLHAISTLVDKGVNIRALVVGPAYGSQKTYHQKLIDLTENLGIIDIVEWAGPRSDVRPLLRRMDVYVCSSLAESSPVSVWEAMMMAKPIVSTDVGDVSRHVKDGENGFIVPVGDARVMASRIERLYRDGNLSGQFGSKARVEACREFDPREVAEKTGDIYRRILGHLS